MSDVENDPAAAAKPEPPGQPPNLQAFRAAMRKLMRRLGITQAQLGHAIDEVGDRTLRERLADLGWLRREGLDEIVSALAVMSAKNQTAVVWRVEFEEELRKALGDAPQGYISNIFSPGAPPVPDIFVGEESDYRDICRRLTGLSDGKSIPGISIFGMGGIGKTTIARALIHNESVGRSFPDGIYWAQLGPNSDADTRHHLSTWLRFMTKKGGDLGFTDSPNAMAVEIGRLAMAKRCLFVVDDVWNFETIHAMQPAFAGSAYLITTREDRLAHSLVRRSEDAYQLSGLNDSDSLKLIGMLAPDLLRSHKDKLLEMSRNLQGLPLAIRVAVNLLNRELGRGFFDSVEDIFSSLGQLILHEYIPVDRSPVGKSSRVFEVFDLSFLRLPETVKLRFLLLSEVDADPSVFSIDEAAAIWGCNKTEAKKTLRELLDLSLIINISPDRFQLHQFMREFLRMKIEGYGELSA